MIIHSIIYYILNYIPQSDNTLFKFNSNMTELSSYSEILLSDRDTSDAKYSKKLTGAKLEDFTKELLLLASSSAKNRKHS